MRRRQRIGMFMVAAVALAGPARAQQEASSALATQYVDERAGLGLDAAIALALAREPSLRAVRADIEIGHGLRQQASLRPNPTVTFERRDEPTGTDSQTSVGVAWPLDLFRRSARVQTAEQGLQVAQFAATDRERLLAADVRMRYGAAAAAVRDVTVAEEILAAAQRQWDLVRARVDVGASPPLERDLLDVELRRLEVERLLAIGRADVALVQLKPLLGMSADEPLLLGETLEALVAGRGTETVSVTPVSVARRPDVREAAARVALADARVEQARREGRADLSLFGMYMQMDSSSSLAGGSIGALGSMRRRLVAGGAMLMVPVFNRNQGQVAAARAERIGAEARREAAELAARAEVVAAEAREAQAERAVNLYSAGVRTLARQNLDVVRQTFDLGRATVFDVLAEQRRYLEIEQGYTSALREAWDARAELRRARGETQ